MLNNSIKQLPYLMAVKDMTVGDGIPHYTQITEYCAWFFGFQAPEQAFEKTDYELPSKIAEFADEYIHCDKIVFHQKQKILTLEFLESPQRLEIALVEKKLLDPKHVVLNMTLITNTPLTKGVFTIFAKHPHKSSWLLGKEYPNLGLTQRQQECLFHLIHGKGYKEIAKLLNISLRTVEHHIEQIRNTLNCSHKSMIISKAFDEGFAYFIPLSIIQSGLPFKAT